MRNTVTVHAFMVLPMVPMVYQYRLVPLVITIGTNGTIGKDRWYPILQTTYSEGKITNAWKSYDPIRRFKTLNL